jgi:hypothetical protein
MGLSTYCPGTPENWKEFNRFKSAIQAGTATKPVSLHGQISSENKRLRAMSIFLPGHEPDR